jgi:putative transposase
MSISDFIGQIKGATAFRVNRDVQPKFKLRWQEGYGALTLREEELTKVSQYIDRQEEHHRSGRLSALLERLHAAEDTSH